MGFEEPKISVRGIYSTALTRLLSKLGFPIVNPSSAIAERLGISSRRCLEDVSIEDKTDGEGVNVRGQFDRAELVIRALTETLPDPVVRDRTLNLHAFIGPGHSLQVLPGYVFFEVEFPHGSKCALDSIRSTVLPTIEGHHQLKLVDSEKVEESEAALAHAPEKKSEISQRLREELIHRYHEVGKVLLLEHVKLEGETIRLPEGRIMVKDMSKLVLRRQFTGGSAYDGLDMPKEEGDYAITEVEEGSWKMRHRYFAADGNLKGEFWNINTSIEFYPDRIRYVDLDVDVVKAAKERPRIIDREKLDRAVEEGYVAERVAEKAIEIAENLLKQLQ